MRIKREIFVIIIFIVSIFFTLDVLNKQKFLPFNETIINLLFDDNDIFLNPTWPKSSIIGHGFFGIDNYSRTSSKEAFLLGYQKGIRTFEVDMLLSSDNKLILLHSWKDYFNQKNYEGDGVSEKKFLKTKIYNKYTPLNYEDLLNLMAGDESIYIVTDTKYYEDSDKEKIITEFNQIVETAKKNNQEKLLDHLIIQIYNEKMLDIVEEIYPFQNVIITLYNIWDGNETDFKMYSEFAKKHNLVGITIDKKHYTDNIQSIANDVGIELYLHTVNDEKDAKKYIESGVKGIYTDTLLEKNLK